MKRWILWSLVLLAVVLLMKEENRPGTDIAGLEPVRTLWVEAGSDGLRLAADGGLSGQGADLAAAVKDMEQTAYGQVFLDTAEYLLVSPAAVKWLPELMKILRPSCRVYLADKVTDLETVTEYLSAREPGVTLGDWRKGKTNLPVLYVIEERMYLAKP